MLFTVGDSKVIASYDLAPPSGQPVMRLTGSLTHTTSWQYGIGSHSSYAEAVRIYGKRSNGSLGDYLQVGFSNSDGSSAKAFDYIYSENYPTLHVEIVMSFYGDWGTNTLYTASITGTAQCYKGIYNIDESDIGTILSNTQSASNAANAANTAAQNASAYAQQANANASNASTYAQQANTNAANASDRSWYEGTYGGTVQSVGNVAGYIAYNQLLGITTKIDSLSNVVTNIQNNMGADTSPPSVKISTVSGALAASSNSIRAVVNVSDNVSMAFNYSFDGFVFQPLPADGVITLPLYNSGSNLVTVWVKDEAGNTGRGSITIRKLA